jgi:hypothetical protein
VAAALEVLVLLEQMDKIPFLTLQPLALLQEELLPQVVEAVVLDSQVRLTVLLAGLVVVVAVMLLLSKQAVLVHLVKAMLVVHL